MSSTKQNKRVFEADVTIQTIYSDGSGAPAVATACGLRWSVDFLGGEVKLHRLDRQSWITRSIVERSIQLVTKAYSTQLKEKAPQGWFELNRAMYAA
jgi:hypothetical protein